MAQRAAARAVGVSAAVTMMQLARVFSPILSIGFLTPVFFNDSFPLQMHQGGDIRWVDVSYTAIHHVLTNPVYAGAYTYGKTRQETTLDAAGVRRKRIRHLPRSEWQVLIPEHHPGFIDWRTYEANQARIAQNTRPGPHKVGGAVREGGALGVKPTFR